MLEAYVPLFEMVDVIPFNETLFVAFLPTFWIPGHLDAKGGIRWVGMAVTLVSPADNRIGRQDVHLRCYEGRNSVGHGSYFWLCLWR